IPWRAGPGRSRRRARGAAGRGSEAGEVTIAQQRLEALSDAPVALGGEMRIDAEGRIRHAAECGREILELDAELPGERLDPARRLAVEPDDQQARAGG